MVSVGVYRHLACSEIHFIEPDVKVNGAYHRDNLLAKKLLSDIFRKSQGRVLFFNRTVHWRIERTTPSLSWSKMCLTSFFSNTVVAEFNGSEPIHPARRLECRPYAGESLLIQNS